MVSNYLWKEEAEKERFLLEEEYEFLASITKDTITFSQRVAERHIYCELAKRLCKDKCGLQFTSMKVGEYDSEGELDLSLQKCGDLVQKAMAYNLSNYVLALPTPGKENNCDQWFHFKPEKHVKEILLKHQQDELIQEQILYLKQGGRANHKNHSHRLRHNKHKMTSWKFYDVIKKFGNETLMKQSISLYNRQMSVHHACGDSSVTVFGWNNRFGWYENGPHVHDVAKKRNELYWNQKKEMHCVMTHNVSASAVMDMITNNCQTLEEMLKNADIAFLPMRTWLYKKFLLEESRNIPTSLLPALRFSMWLARGAVLEEIANWHSKPQQEANGQIIATAIPETSTENKEQKETAQFVTGSHMRSQGGGNSGMAVLSGVASAAAGLFGMVFGWLGGLATGAASSVASAGMGAVGGTIGGTIGGISGAGTSRGTSTAQDFLDDMVDEATQTDMSGGNSQDTGMKTENDGIDEGTETDGESESEKNNDEDNSDNENDDDDDDDSQDETDDEAEDDAEESQNSTMSTTTTPIYNTTANTTETPTEEDICLVDPPSRSKRMAGGDWKEDLCVCMFSSQEKLSELTRNEVGECGKSDAAKQLIPLDRLANNGVEGNVYASGCQNEADLILVRGNLEFFEQWDDCDAAKAYTNMKYVCAEHASKLGLDWEKHGNPKKKRTTDGRQIRCMFPQNVEGASNHQSARLAMPGLIVSRDMAKVLNDMKRTYIPVGAS